MSRIAKRYSVLTLLGIYCRVVLRVALDHDDGSLLLGAALNIFSSMYRNVLQKVRLCDCTPLSLASRVGQWTKELEGFKQLGQSLKICQQPESALLAHKPGCYVPFEAILGFDPCPLTALAHDGNLFPAGQHLTIRT